jgi:hypothetical protein
MTRSLLQLLGPTFAARMEHPMRWRTELLDHYTCLNSIRPTALREARSVRQYQYCVSLDHMLMQEPRYR